MSFLNTGVSVISESNYSIWTILKELSFSSLSHNLGFLLSLIYWCSFFLLLILFNELDRRKLKNKFFALILRSSRRVSPTRADSSKSILFSKVTPKSLGPYEVKYKRAHSIFLPRRATLASQQSTQKPSLPSIRYNVEMEKLQNVSEPSERTDR